MTAITASSRRKPLWTILRLFATLPPPQIAATRSSLRAPQLGKQDTWRIMKFQTWFILLLATQLMAAAPPLRQPAAPSAWEKLKNGAQRLIPKSPTRSQSSQRSTHMPPEIEINSDRVGSALTGQSSDLRRDTQVRPATAVESLPHAPGAARKSKKPPRPALLTREKRPARTLSQYMAEEKP